MRRNRLSIYIIIGLVAIILIMIAVFRGSKDEWVCQNGLWVKQGNPKTARPTTGCEPPAGSFTVLPGEEELYCTDNGGKVSGKTKPNGEMYGVCTFEDGKECELNSFKNKRCHGS